MGWLTGLLGVLLGWVLEYVVAKLELGASIAGVRSASSQYYMNEAFIEEVRKALFWPQAGAMTLPRPLLLVRL